MTQRDSIETNNDVPTDEALVDYLMGEAVDHEAIERWLALDESHVLRLERLAEVICGVADKSLVAPLRPHDVSSTKSLVAGSLSTRFWVGLATLAASITLIVAWSRNRDSVQPLTNDRLARVWADVVSSNDLANPLAVELSGLWPSDVDVISSDAATDPVDAWFDDEPIAAGEFASGDDSPPQWLLVAVSQMPEEPPMTSEDGGDNDTLDQEEVR